MVALSTHAAKVGAARTEHSTKAIAAAAAQTVATEIAQHNPCSTGGAQQAVAGMIDASGQASAALGDIVVQHLRGRAAAQQGWEQHAFSTAQQGRNQQLYRLAA
jgi:hypothetical protein